MKVTRNWLSYRVNSSSSSSNYNRSVVIAKRVTIDGDAKPRKRSSPNSRLPTSNRPPKTIIPLVVIIKKVITTVLIIIVNNNNNNNIIFIMIAEITTNLMRIELAKAIIKIPLATVKE